MKHDLALPPTMMHMKLDERGYPIPFFVPVINGKPDFRYLDQKKQLLCLEKKLCAICGKRLLAKQFWFISGPVGMSNAVSSDPPMHEQCARFSIEVCPHLLYKKAERRSDASLAMPYHMDGKPESMYLIKADKYDVTHAYGKKLIKYRKVHSEQFIYVNGRLTKASDVQES